MTVLLKPTFRARAQLLNLYQPRVGDGCVLWLPGQDDPQSSTIRDRSGLGNNGTIVGATWARTPKGLWYLSFDGNDDNVTVADKAEFDVGAELTLKLWFRTDTDTADDVLVIHDESATKYAFWMSGTGGDLYFIVNTASGSSNAFYDGANSYFSDSVWRHIVGTYDKSLADNRLKLFIDGALAAQGTGHNEDIAAGDEGITFGHYAAVYMKHDMALPVICNKAWNAGRILDNYNQERHLFGV